MPGDYIKCPRCELNYIKRGEEYCAVCKAELKKGPQLIFAIDDEDDNELLDLCPVCHQNHIRPGEKMCAKCLEEKEYKDGREDMDDDSWKEYLDTEEEEEEEDEEMLSLNKLAEEEGDFDEEEEEEDIIEEEDDDDFDIPTNIDQSDFEDTDEEDEEDEEDDEDEDF